MLRSRRAVRARRERSRTNTMRDDPLVLVAEADEPYLETVVLGLRGEGFAVEAVRDGAAALHAHDTLHPNVVLLDVDLPGISGLEVCRELRARAPTPVILMSARKTSVDAVDALEVGADDFVASPHRMRELVARVRAVLRRHVVPPAVDEHDVVEIGDVRVDAARHLVHVRGHVVHLPLKEFELLALLVRNAGRVLSRGILMDRVWGPDYRGDPKTLDVHVKRLRGRIEDDPTKPSRIVTVRGVGYRYERNGG